MMRIIIALTLVFLGILCCWLLWRNKENSVLHVSFVTPPQKIVAQDALVSATLSSIHSKKEMYQYQAKQLGINSDDVNCMRQWYKDFSGKWIFQQKDPVAILTVCGNDTIWPSDLCYGLWSSEEVMQSVVTQPQRWIQILEDPRLSKGQYNALLTTLEVYEYRYHLKNHSLQSASRPFFGRNLSFLKSTDTDKYWQELIKSVSDRRREPSMTIDKLVALWRTNGATISDSDCRLLNEIFSNPPPDESKKSKN